MKYMCLIYDSEAGIENMTEQDFEQEIGAYMAFDQTIQEAGVATGLGEALQPSATATVVKMRDGKTLTTSGPFAETKEQLGHHLRRSKRTEFGTKKVGGRDQEHDQHGDFQSFDQAVKETRDREFAIAD